MNTTISRCLFLTPCIWIWNIHLNVSLLLLFLNLHHLHSPLIVFSSLLILEQTCLELTLFHTLIYSVCWYFIIVSCFCLSIIAGSGCMSKWWWWWKFVDHLLTGMTSAAKVLPLTTRLSYIMFWGAIFLLKRLVWGIVSLSFDALFEVAVVSKSHIPVKV